MKRAWLALVLLVVTVSQASAWGKEGHMAIADAAQGALTAPASAAIARILGEDTLSKGALADIATWADDLRQGGGPDWDAQEKRDGARFNKAWKNNAEWHFVNLPLGAGAYPNATPPKDDPMNSFVGPDDVVQALGRTITVLETSGPTKNFSKEQAVKWIVHLVGDIHQPLHVTTGYYDTSSLATPKLIRIPAKADDEGVLGDRGANGLLFGAEQNNLHAAWDVCMVLLTAGKPCSANQDSYEALSAKLTQLMQTQDAQAYRMTGDHHSWPAVWATDSLKVANSSKAYEVRLTDGAVQQAHHGNEHYVQATISSPSKDDYTSNHQTIVEAQLTKAAVRLADLLNKIDWK